MSLNTSHIVPARREEVWAWHSRPGAVARLSPPFFPFTPITQTTDLAKGTTVFALPAGLCQGVSLYRCVCFRPDSGVSHLAA